MGKRKSDKKKGLLNRSKAIRGLEREEHFKNGGTLTSWRGVHKIQTSKGERRNRTRRDKEGNAIKESLE